MAKKKIMTKRDAAKLAKANAGAFAGVPSRVQGGKKAAMAKAGRVRDVGKRLGLGTDLGGPKSNEARKRMRKGGGMSINEAKLRNFAEKQLAGSRE